MSAKRKFRKSVRRKPGEVRDAIVETLTARPNGATIPEIQDGVRQLIGTSVLSSVRSYLRLNTGSLFRREGRGIYVLREAAEEYRSRKRNITFNTINRGRSLLVEGDCMDWLRQR